MKFESSFNKSKEKKNPEKEEKKSIFEIRKKVKEFNILIGLKRDKEPLTGSIDLENKKAEIQVTPEGMVGAVKAISDFFKNPQNRKKVEDFSNKGRKWLSKKKEQKEDKKAKETIKDFAEQEGKKESEMIEEFLNEFKDKEEKEKN